MNGTITFESAEELAEFLKHFTGSTAIFDVLPDTHGGYKLTFRGGF
jgi:hypothetical protein